MNTLQANKKNKLLTIISTLILPTVFLQLTLQKLSAETFDLVRVTLGLKPLLEAEAKGKEITAKINIIIGAEVMVTAA